MPQTQRMDLGVPPKTEDELDDETTQGGAPDDDTTAALGPRVVRASSPSSPSSSARRAARARRCPTCQQAFSGEARFCPFDGDPLDEAPDWNPSADPLIGTLIDGRYEVVSVIGEGGMGTVYEAKHATLGRKMAIKVLRRDIADAEHTARFVQEAKAAAAVGHPNIIAVSDFGELTLPAMPRPEATPSEAPRPRVPYFVMEHLTGISLAELLRAEKTLSADRAARILFQCASGLSAAHAAGVVHRDLKPDNVFLVRSGDRELVKLLDFGVAKMAGAGRLTRAGMVFGTPHYMSPEQAAGESVDHRADVYALGVILYECFAGRVPFEADTYMGVLTKHMFATPEPIERVAPDPSGLGVLAPVVMRCLAKAPADRYASMAELGAALEAAIGEPLRAPGAPAMPGEPRASQGPRSPRFASAGDLPVTPVKPVLGPVTVGVGIVALGVVAAVAFRGLRGDAATTAPTASAAASAPPAGSASAPAASSVAPLASASLPAATATADSAKGVASAGPSPGRPPALGPGKVPRHKGQSGSPSGDVVDPWR